MDDLKHKTCLAFSGGGILGIAHAGALDRLNELGGLTNLKCLVGTSVGSIIASALACGATTDYIKTKMFSLDLTRFQDGGNWFKKGIRLLFRYGIHKGQQVEDFAEDFLKELTGNGDITFLQAHNLFGTHLTIPYLSVRYRKTMYADYIKTPDLPIKKAILWSSSIPYFFQSGRKNTGLQDLYVDGGVTDTYPIHVLREQKCKASDILGFRLCGELEFNQYQNPGKDIDHGLPCNIVNYSLVLLDIIRQQALNYHVDVDDWKLTCKIDIGKYKVTDFDIDEEGKIWLFNSGRAAIDKYMEELHKEL